MIHYQWRKKTEIGQSFRDSISRSPINLFKIFYDKGVKNLKNIDLLEKSHISLNLRLD
jgi:hypothetical protein